MGLQEQIHEQAFDGLPVMADPVIACRLANRRMLQPVQHRLAGERCAVGPLRGQALRQKGEDRIMTERVVIVHVLVPESNGGNPLSNQGAPAMNRAIAIAPINEAGGHPVEQPDGSIGMVQQHSARV